MRDKLVICYHGTDKENAENIGVNGFKQGTYFATHLEDALEFGGEYIFEVMFNTALSEIPYKDWDWQFIAKELIPPDRIVFHYKLLQEKLFEDILLRERILKSNLDPNCPMAQ